MSTTKQKTIGFFLICLSLFFAGLSVYFYFENDNSLARIKENEKTIKVLEADKLPLKAVIAENEKQMAKDQETIIKLVAREAELLTLLKQQKNENDKELTDYFNADDDKRVSIFSGLATDED